MKDWGWSQVSGINASEEMKKQIIEQNKAIVLIAMKRDGKVEARIINAPQITLEDFGNAVNSLFKLNQDGDQGLQSIELVADAPEYVIVYLAFDS